MKQNINLYTKQIRIELKTAVIGFIFVKSTKNVFLINRWGIRSKKDSTNLKKSFFILKMGQGMQKWTKLHF